VHVSEEAHTARFLCTTDADMCQIASFYPGAMSEARNIELQPVADRVGGLDLVVVSPNDPDAMLRHTQECRQRGIPFAADPSQQLARMDGDDIRTLIDGAAYLLTNDYEKGLVELKTGWSDAEVLSRVGTRVTTHGPKGVVIEQQGQPALSIEVVPEHRKADPTGVGDAFRAASCPAGTGLSLERSAQVGQPAGHAGAGGRRAAGILRGAGAGARPLRAGVRRGRGRRGRSHAVGRGRLSVSPPRDPLPADQEGGRAVD